MTRERWRRIKDVLDAAVGLPSTKRETYLAAACAGDAELRRQVDSLVASGHLKRTRFANA
jgi:hypothetical protein